MRTRKFLSTLIPALPMLLAALLVILVTVIFLTAMRSKAHAQFGGAEQPMFQLLSQTTDLPPGHTNLILWYVASDLSDGSVSGGWTDRISGRILTNAVVANRPTKTSNYVSFASKYLSNSIGLSIAQDFRFGAIISSPGPWSTIRCFYDATADGSSALPAGYYFRSSVQFFNLTVYGQDFTSFTNGIIFDLLRYQTNNTTFEKTITNGIYVGEFNVGGPFASLTKFGFGNSSDQTTRPWTGKIYEILIWTNGPYFDSVFGSNFHRYATNKYGPYYIP